MKEEKPNIFLYTSKIFITLEKEKKKKENKAAIRKNDDS